MCKRLHPGYFNRKYIWLDESELIVIETTKSENLIKVIASRLRFWSAECQEVIILSKFFLVDVVQLKLVVQLEQIVCLKIYISWVPLTGVPWRHAYDISQSIIHWCKCFWGV